MSKKINNKLVTMKVLSLAYQLFDWQIIHILIASLLVLNKFFYKTKFYFLINQNNKNKNNS